MYKDQLPLAGLYWEQLADRGKVLKALNTPKLGDSLLRADGTPWMTALAHQAPKINWNDLAQIPALPLGSWLKTDPWDDRVHMLNAKRYLPMNPRDKMPLEVTPVYFKLQRYTAENTAPATAAQPAPGNNPGGDAAPAAPAQGTSTPAQGTSTPAQGTSTPQTQPAPPQPPQ